MASGCLARTPGSKRGNGSRPSDCWSFSSIHFDSCDFSHSTHTGPCETQMPWDETCEARISFCFPVLLDDSWANQCTLIYSREWKYRTGHGWTPIRRIVTFSRKWQPANSGKSMTCKFSAILIQEAVPNHFLVEIGNTAKLWNWYWYVRFAYRNEHRVCLTGTFFT